MKRELAPNKPRGNDRRQIQQQKLSHKASAEVQARSDDTMRRELPPEKLTSVTVTNSSKRAPKKHKFCEESGGKRWADEQMTSDQAEDFGTPPGGLPTSRGRPFRKSNNTDF